jgi:hypothetical protein
VLEFPPLVLLSDMREVSSSAHEHFSMLSLLCRVSFVYEVFGNTVYHSDEYLYNIKRDERQFNIN